MKKPSSELFLLVKSLDAQEKAFVHRLLHNNNKESISHALFSKLCNQTVYNEHEVVVSIKKITPSTIKHCKQTLINFILQALDLYHANSTVESLLNRTLAQIRILRNKKMFIKATKLAHMAIKKAEAHGLFLLHIQLLSELKYILIESDDVEGFDRLKINNQKTYKILIDDYIIFQKNEETMSVLRKLSLKDGWYPGNKKIQLVDNIYKSHLSNIDSKDFHKKSSRINIQELSIRYYCLLLLNDYTNAQKQFELLFNEYENSIKKILLPEEFLFHINTGITICVFTKDITLFKKLSASIEAFIYSLPKKAKTVQVLTTYYTIKNNEIAFLTHSKEFNSAILNAENLVKNITNFIKPSVRKIFWSNLCQLYLYVGEIKLALKAFNTIKNNREYDAVRLDIDPGTNLLGMAIFYELNALDNVESLIRSSARKLLSIEQPNVFFKLIDFFKILLFLESNSEKINHFQTILNDIKNIKAGSPDSFFLENTLIEIWVKNFLTKLQLKEE